MDLRLRVAAACDEGMNTAEVAEMFGCSPAWVRRLKQRRRGSGSLEPLERKAPSQRAIKEDQEQKLRRFINQKPDATLAEVASFLKTSASNASISRTLTRMGLPRKKSPSMPASRTGRM